MEILTLSAVDAPAAVRAMEVLEHGGLVLLPHHPFPLLPEELRFLDPALLKRGVKNISLDPATGLVSGAKVAGSVTPGLTEMITRYAAFAAALVEAVAPRYGPALQRRRTSFRPGPVDTRVLSPSKDDRRLHLDAFSSNPVQGRRILRVFTNVDPDRRPRVWALGEDGVCDLAEIFRPDYAAPGPSVLLQERLGLIKGRRTAYDRAMLQLHDRAKLDDEWQAKAPRRRIDLPAGASWVVFTDGVIHAALEGQNAFEQTWLLPVAAMAEPERSPLRVLEQASDRALA